jgi:tetratricopeptide (TPR) repeat protein
MAQTLLDQGQLPEAKLLLEQVCKTDRQDSEGWYGLGIVNGMIGDFATARDCFENVVRLRPNMARAYINLAKAFVGMGQYEAAVSAYRAALNITPGDLDTHRYLNATLVRMGRLDDAIAGYDRMLALSPGNPELLAAKAKIFEIRGNKKQAYEQLGPLIEQYPKNPNIAVAFAAVCKEVDKCDDAIRMLESILASPESRLHHEIECEISFALGNLYDDRKDYDKAFGHYLHANRIKGRTFDIANFAGHIDDVIHTFTAEALKKAPQSTLPTGSAVFIVGMPRSGTSLVEQILASHPEVAAGGELHDFANLVIEIQDLVDSRKRYPRYLNDLTTDICNTVAQRYLDRLAGISTTSRYITNKMPQNFLYLGLVSRILPQARIIHCRRDPRDTCVSCFFQDL